MMNGSPNLVARLGGGGGLGVWGWEGFGDYGEVLEGAHAEGGGDGYVGCVASSGHQYAADARMIVAGVEGPPAIFEIGFEPGAEIHRGLRDRDADIAQVS